MCRTLIIVGALLVAVLLVLGACAPASDVQITYIFYDGLVPQVESDEYVEITNLGDQAQDLAGWVLKDISEGYPSFTFPSYDGLRAKAFEFIPMNVIPNGEDLVLNTAEPFGATVNLM